MDGAGTMPVRTTVGVLTVALLIAAACSRGDSTSGDNELLSDELPIENPPTEDYNTSQDIEMLLSASSYHPESVSESAPYRVGVLAVEEPCVYVELAVGNVSQSPLEVRSTTNGNTSPTPLQARHTTRGNSLRTFLRFPKSVTRYNKTTQQIWVDDAGPMTSGDAVILNGDIYSHRDWATGVLDEVCVANAIMFVRSMQPWPVLPKRTDSNIQIEDADLIDPEDDLERYLQGDWIVGILVVDLPCVYVEFAHPKEYVSSDSAGRVRTLIDNSDLDIDNNGIPVGNNVRLETGDEVVVIGDIRDDNRPRTEKIYIGREAWDGTLVGDACVAHSVTIARLIEPYASASRYLHLADTRSWAR